MLKISGVAFKKVSTVVQILFVYLSLIKMFCPAAVALRQLNTETHKVPLYSLGIHMHMVEIDDIMFVHPTHGSILSHTLNNSNL